MLQPLVINMHIHIRIIHFNSVFLLSEAQQEPVIVSLYNYPPFGDTELTICMGEQLTVLSEYVTWLLISHHPPFLRLIKTQFVMSAYFCPTATVIF